MEITLKPVGVARNAEIEQHFGGWKNVVSDIVLDKKYKDALDGLEGYSHVLVVYWMHGAKKRVIKHRPQGIGPLVGIFACRCQGRPNPIGISSAKIIGRKGNVLSVKGLDVINGTPVLDIKPYTPQYDLIKNAQMPKWAKELKY